MNKITFVVNALRIIPVQYPCLISTLCKIVTNKQTLLFLNEKGEKSKCCLTPSRVLLSSLSSSVFLTTRYQIVSFASPSGIDTINIATFKILMPAIERHHLRTLDVSKVYSHLVIAITCVTVIP